MPLTKETFLLATHAWFYRNGSVVTSIGNYTGADVGAASATRKPGPTDPLWIDLGAIEESTDARESTKFESWIPSPGALQLKKVIESKRKITHKFTCSELSAFVFEMLYGTNALDSSSTQFNQLEGGSKTGWLKIQRYDQDNNLRLTIDSWVFLEVTNEPNFGGSEIAKVDFSAMLMHSTLNTGTL